jgi:eukaryotic-like serine/threonine-protein kinase
MAFRVEHNAEPIPGYRLIERLGGGGFGEVWSAVAPGGMHKAIKFVSGDVDDFGQEGKAVEQEYKSLSRIKTIRHPFLLSLERFEVINRQLVIVMELADRNLWDRFTECVRKGWPGIPRPELLRYMEEAAEALDLMNLHHQIQHLDVKPHNIFLVHQHVKVADFGLAKDLEGTRADMTGGVTPTYAPPETFEGWVSRQSDQYSLAIVFMEMLTGRRPFPGGTTRQLVFQHLTVPPDLSPLVAADREAVGRALSKAPDERFPTCTEFVQALRGDDRSVIMPTPAPVDTPVGPSRGTSQWSISTPLTSRRSVPALVTPLSKHSTMSSTVRSRPTVEAAAPIGPRPEQTGDGVLFPALVVGVGQLGLSVVRALRQHVSDWFGAPTLPHLRWLYIDTDPAGGEAAIAGPGTAALHPDDVMIARLRRPAHYLAREGLPAVDTWLPQEELFRIPRTPATDGIRGLGRLALCDHYHVVRHRIQAALEPFLHPTAIEAAQRLTGLGLRSTFPRVYLATSLGGGAGSGMFLDLAYLIRRVARQLGFGSSQVVGLLGVPTFVPAAGDLHRLANARAALTELHHFVAAGARYRAHFDTREDPLDDSERPFRRCVLVPMGNRFDPIATSRAVDTAAHAAFAELLTPLGPVAHPDAGEPPAPFAIAGMRRLAWPRAAVVRAAGWVLARRTLENWAGKESSDKSSVATAVDALWNARPLARATVRPVLEQRLAERLGGASTALIASRLQALANGSRAGSSDAALARNAMRNMLDLFGRPGQDEDERPHQVGRVLADYVRELAERANAKLGEAILALVEKPGLRVAGAERVVRLMRQRLVDELAHTDREAAAIDDESQTQFVALHHQLLSPTATGPKLPGGYAEAIRRWAETRAAGVLERGCASLYRALLGYFPEHLRDLTALRNQMAALVAQLDADPPALPAPDGVALPIFPELDGTAAEAASRLVMSLTPEEVREFESAFQSRLGAEFRTLAAVCARPMEAGPPFLRSLREQATHFLDMRIAQMTAPQVLALHAGEGDGLREKVAELVATAAPAALGSGQALGPIMTVVGTPSDDAAVRLVEYARQLSPGMEFRTAPTDRDIVIYQEAAITLASLPHLTAELPEPTGPDRRRIMAHSRTDVSWAPVDSQ